MKVNFAFDAVRVFTKYFQLISPWFGHSLILGEKKSIPKLAMFMRNN